MYKVVIDCESGLICFFFLGASSACQVDEAMQELLSIHAREGFTRVLIDHTAAVDALGMAELLRIAEALAGPAYRDFRLAAFPSNLHLGVEFTRAIACQKGLRFSNFPNEQAARAWLFSDQQPRPLRHSSTTTGQLA